MYCRNNIIVIRVSSQNVFRDSRNLLVVVKSLSCSSEERDETADLAASSRDFIAAADNGGDDKTAHP